MKSMASARQHEHGATLVIGLLTLVLLSLIGISATSTGRVEVQISGNDKAAKEAFYASELALTTGEITLEDLLNRIELNEDTAPERYGQGTAPAWHALVWNDTDSAAVPYVSIPAGLNELTVPPRYTIEQRRFRRDSLTQGIGVPTGVYLFNVTAQGTGGSHAQVVLQTIYAKRFN
jgi:type IV pilus assembly protein PilX